MPRLIQVEERLLEFPDDTPDEVISQTIRREFAPPDTGDVLKYGFTSGVSSLQRMVGGGLELAGELPFLDKVGEAGKGIKESANINEELARPPNMTKGQELGASAVGSAVSAAPFMTAGILGGGLGAAGKIAEGGWKAAAPVMNRAANIALGGMAGGVGLEKYGELRGEGMGVGRSLTHGAIEAGAEFIGEKIPLKWALKALPEHKIASFLAQWFGREVLGEEVTTVLQNANAMAAGKDLSLSDWLQSMADTAVVTAMLGPLQTAALSPVIALANKQVRDAAVVQLVKEIEAASKTPPPAAPEVVPEPGVVTEDNRPQEQPAPQPPTADEVAMEEGEEVLYSLADTDALVDAARAKAEEMKAKEAVQSPSRRNFLKQLGGMAAAAAVPMPRMEMADVAETGPADLSKWQGWVDDSGNEWFWGEHATDPKTTYQIWKNAGETTWKAIKEKFTVFGPPSESSVLYKGTFDTAEAAVNAMNKLFSAEMMTVPTTEPTHPLLEEKELPTSQQPVTREQLTTTPAETPKSLTATPQSPALPQETTPPEANPADKYVADTLESYEASTQELLQRLNEDNQVSKRSLENLQGNYKNPNNGKRITSLPVTWSNNNKHKGPFVPSKLGDGDVVVVGEESDVFPSEYTHAVGKVVNWVNGKFFGGRGRFVIVLKSSTRRGPSSVSNHRMVMGTHYLQVPHALSLVKELTSGQPVGEYNAHRLASIYTSVFHELGHAIQEALFYEGLGRTTAEFLHHNTNDFDPIPQAIIDRIEDPLKRAVVQEYSDLKTQLFATNPAVPGVEFFKQWLGPAKYNYKYLYDWKVVSGEREPALLSLEGEVTVRDVVNRMERSTRGAAKWASFNEYFAEQLARWAYGKPKGVAQTAMGKLFSRVINEYASMLRGVFKAAKADGVFKPGVKFQDWLDSLTSVPTVDPKTLYKAPDDDTAKELKTDVELDDKLEKRKKGVKVRQERKAKQEAEQPITEDGMKKVMRAALSPSEFAAAWPGIKKAWDNKDPVEATDLFDIAMGNTKGSFNIEAWERINAWAEELGVGQVDQAGLNAEQAKNPKLRARAAAVWKRMHEKSPFLKAWFGNWEENIPDEKLQLFPVWNLEGQVIRDYATKPDVSHVTYLNGAPMVAVSTANIFYNADIGQFNSKAIAEMLHESAGRLGRPTLLPVVTDGIATNTSMLDFARTREKFLNEPGLLKIQELEKEERAWSERQEAEVSKLTRLLEKNHVYQQNIDNVDPMHARKWTDYFRAEYNKIWKELDRAGGYIETIRAERAEIANDPEYWETDWRGMPVYVNVRNPYYVDAGGQKLTTNFIHQLFFRATQGEHDALWVFNAQMNTGRGWFIIPFSTDQVKRMDSLTFGQRTGDLHFNIDETTPEGQGVADTLRILNAVERQERMWADSGKVPKTEYDPDAVATRALKTFKGTVYNRPIGRALLRFLRAKNAFLQFQQLQQLNPDIDGARAGISHARDYYRDSSGLTNMGQEVALGLGDLSKTETKALWDIREAEARGGVHWTKIVEITDRNLPSRSPAIKAFLNLPDSVKRGFIKFEHVPTEDTLERLKPFFDKQKVPEARREKLTQLYLAMKNSHLLQILFHKQEFLRTFMTRYEKASEEEKARQYMNVEAKFDAIIQRPYIEPSLFGNYLIQVFATIEGKKTLVWKEAHEDPKIWAARAKELGGKLKSGETLELKELTDKQYVLLAMPLEFLDDAARELGLTQEQVRTLESLLNPAKPDKAIGRYDLRHLQIPGGSEDLARAYSTFFWHQTNYIVKMKFRPQFRTAIGMVKRQIKAMNLAQLDPQLKAQHVFRMQGVLKALNESTDYLMHPTSELEWLRSFVSTAYLGFNLKTALMNFYGVITTFSSITSEVGVAKGNQLFFTGMKIAFDSAFRMDLLRKKDPELADAIDAAVAQGVLSQSYAFALAGQAIANYWERLWRRAGDRIDSWLGGNVEVSRWGRKATRALINGGMAPFQMTERASRRVTFVIKYLEARELNAQAKAAGIPQPFPWPNDLSTYAARQTEILQNDYTRFNRPPVMRAGGPLGAIIPAGTIFLSFGQHMAFQAYGGHEIGKRREQRMFGENPKNWMAGYTTKIWLITLMVAGLKGLPGFENIFDILNGIYRKLFGKTAEQDIRDFVTAASNGAIDPLMVMYGLSHNVGGFDISRSIGFGRIVPGTDVLTRPTDSPTEVIGGTITSLMGPLGSMVYYMVRLGYDPTYSNFAKFPGGVGSMLQAWDWQTNGVRGPLGNRLTFEADGTLRDVTTSEVIGRAAGFRPEIVSRNQEAHFEMYDMKKYWQHRRANVFALMYEAHLRQDREAQADAREAWKDYNSDVPKEYPELRITPKDMSNAVFTRLRNVHKLEAGVPVERRYRRMQEDIKDSFNASARE